MELAGLGSMYVPADMSAPVHNINNMIMVTVNMMRIMRTILMKSMIIVKRVSWYPFVHC